MKVAEMRDAQYKVEEMERLKRASHILGMPDLQMVCERTRQEVRIRLTTEVREALVSGLTAQLSQLSSELIALGIDDPPDTTLPTIEVINGNPDRAVQIGGYQSIPRGPRWVPKPQCHPGKNGSWS